MCCNCCNRSYKNIFLKLTAALAMAVAAPGAWGADLSFGGRRAIAVNAEASTGLDKSYVDENAVGATIS